MIGIVEFGSAISSLKAAKNLIQAFNGIKTATQLNEVKITLQGHILEGQQGLFDAQEAQAAASKRIDDLEQQIVRMKDWQAEKQRYELRRYQPGSFAYALKPDVANGEPLHLICAHCYGENKKSLLQGTHKTPARFRVHNCPSCKSEFEFGEPMGNASAASSPAPAVDFSSSSESETWKTV